MHYPLPYGDSRLRPLWQLTNMLSRVRTGVQTKKDVRNGDRSGDVYENKGSIDKMSTEKHDFTQENAPIAR